MLGVYVITSDPDQDLTQFDMSERQSRLDMRPSYLLIENSSIGKAISLYYINP